MTLRELRYLVALADRGHFGRAAEECCVSQPTLSTQIKKLEGYLGVILIERNARSFSFTPIGEELAAKARGIVSYPQPGLQRRELTDKIIVRTGA
jgi:LysR family hydrogen peroxide-inducible transcriptional activator